MSVALHHIVIDAHDLPALARFWSAALGWPILSEREREVIVGPALDAPIGLCFMPSPDEKVVKNRVHLDVEAVRCIADALDDTRAREVFITLLDRPDDGRLASALADLEQAYAGCVTPAQLTSLALKVDG